MKHVAGSDHRLSAIKSDATCTPVFEDDAKRPTSGMFDTLLQTRRRGNSRHEFPCPRTGCWPPISEVKFSV